jgi:hypothetical protein
MSKINSFETLFQTNRFTTNNKFQCISHNIEIKSFIFDLSNDFFLKTYLSKKIVKLLAKALF